MRIGSLLLPLLLGAACHATPPRIDDQSSPEAAYRTFRGALARKEYEREFATLSDELKRRLGLDNRGRWEDVRVVLLNDNHLLVKGIVRSEIDGEPEPLADGRARLRLKFPFGYRGRVDLVRVVVLRIFVKGDDRPRIYEQLDDLEIAISRNALSVDLDPQMVEDWQMFGALEPDDEIERVEVGLEWFLDDFSAGDENPESVRVASAESRAD